jgi:hypothetical protein
MNNFILTELEDEFETREDDLQIRRQGLYPSEASVIVEIDGRKICKGTCMRSAYYRALEFPQTDKPDAKGMNIMKLGKWGENGLVNRWKEMGLWYANSIKFFDAKHFVSGELDAVLKTKENKLIGYEVKTYYGQQAGVQITGTRGRKLKDGGYSDKQPRKVGAPKMGQFLQAVLYSHQYVTLLKKLDEFRLFYLERGDGTRVEFTVGTELRPDGKHGCWWEQVPGKYWTVYEEGKVYQDFTIEDVQERYLELVKRLRERRLPPKDFIAKYDEVYIEWAMKNKLISATKYADYEKGESLGDWECSYCSYKTQCKKDGDTDGGTK